MEPVCIVLPCYNEAERLDVAALERALVAIPGLHLVCVDDGSRDRTRELLESLASSHPERVECLALATNSGKAEAVRQGVLHALAARPGPEAIGYWDADLATPLEELPEMLMLLERDPALELVLASRVKLLGRSIERRAVRHYVGRIFATVVSAMLGLAVYDTQCGAKLFRAGSGLRELFERPFLSRWVFDVEILARLIAARGREGERGAERVVCEHPLHEWRDVAGSKLRAIDFAVAAIDIARIWSRTLRGTRKRSQ